MIQAQTHQGNASALQGIDLWGKGIDAVVETGDFTSREAVLDEALQQFFQAYPQQRLEMAIQLYQTEEVTLARAAEIVGLAALDFQAILRARDVDIVIGDATREDIDQGLAILRGEQ